jgi:hypothetical protein
MSRKITVLKSVGFLLWVHFKNTVYALAVNDVVEQQQRVEDVYELSRNTPEIYECVQ